MIDTAFQIMEKNKIKDLTLLPLTCDQALLPSWFHPSITPDRRFCYRWKFLITTVQTQYEYQHLLKTTEWLSMQIFSFCLKAVTLLQVGGCNKGIGQPGITWQVIWKTQHAGKHLFGLTTDASGNHIRPHAWYFENDILKLIIKTTRIKKKLQSF